MDGEISGGFLCQSHKRTFEQLSDSNTSSPSSWNYPVPGPSTSNTSPPNHQNSGFRLPPIRFEGDGLDLRQPIMSRPPPSIIDLTDVPDSPPLPQGHHAPTARSNRANRPPRFSRNIIDLEADSNLVEGTVVRDGSPDVEVLSSRPTQDPARAAFNNRSVSNYTAMLRPLSFQPGRPQREAERPGIFQYVRNVFNTPRFQVAQPGTPPVVDLNEIQGRFNPSPASLSSLHFDDLDEDEGVFVHQNSGFQLPRDLDFDVTAFAIGGHVPQRPAPTYDAPSSPRQGFTRSPTEDQEIICPNCGDELGLGENDIKQQVWVIKACGHVYCGECAKIRLKGKSRAKHPRDGRFTKCVVDGCMKQTFASPKAMFQIYL